MNNRMTGIAVGFIFLFGLFILFTPRSGDHNADGSVLSHYVGKARAAQNKTKLMKIKAASAQFMAENGYSAPNLQVLVEQGFLNDSDTRDDQGNPLAYSPQGSTVPPAASGMVTMSKSCGKCQKAVANTSKVGDRCPHCGVVWGREVTHRM